LARWSQRKYPEGETRTGRRTFNQPLARERIAGGNQVGDRINRRGKKNQEKRPEKYSRILGISERALSIRAFVPFQSPRKFRWLDPRAFPKHLVAVRTASSALNWRSLSIFIVRASVPNINSFVNASALSILSRRSWRREFIFRLRDTCARVLVASRKVFGSLLRRASVISNSDQFSDIISESAD